METFVLGSMNLMDSCFTAVTGMEPTLANYISASASAITLILLANFVLLMFEGCIYNSLDDDGKADFEEQEDEFRRKNGIA